ncbi:hypothetical protein IE81DRAFT_319786 [Ceraceosorus guamensis]|uniref:WD40 repeat-like protein n=1 Tax=Ceraceosorus guamensis TaxID=1522189 RepID=A0A316W7P3_9BASI|nr:hypothetical protein IE81DRAFT_319786 [Ceraceosorus guamensis]PWN45940.1 hypothetical protein IE81DRAFT_319786 [Ceraceosorus guamensis]
MSLDVDMADGKAETASSPSAARGQQQQRGPVASSSSNTLAVHRTRFLDWSPSSITALAFSPSLPHHSLHVRPVLAIGRDNGNIDICTWVSENSGGDGDAAARDSSGNAKSWIVDSTLVGPAASKIDHLAFIFTSAPEDVAGYSSSTTLSIPRLFSSSGGSILTEHFLPAHLLSHSALSAPSITGEQSAQHFLQLGLDKGRSQRSLSRTLSSGGGAIWSMAADPLSKYLALGCEDGVVRIVDVARGRFEHLTPEHAGKRRADGSRTGVAPRCDRAKTRIVSLAWGSPRRRSAVHGVKRRQMPSTDKEDSSADETDSSDEDEDEDDGWQDSFLVGGTSSSSALIWDAQTGRQVSKLNVDRSRSEQTIVWSCLALPNGQIVLGDSRGSVTFYDARTRTALSGASFGVHGKGADVLCLTAGPDGRTVYAGSVDQRVSEYALIGEGIKAKWVNTGLRKLHTHDIKALAICPPLDAKAVQESKSPASTLRQLTVPILASGGTDFGVTLTPAASPSNFNIGTKGKSSRKNRGSAFRGDTARDLINPVSTTDNVSFAETVQRRLPFVPASCRGSTLGGGAVVSSAPLKRWLSLRRDQSTAIWALPDRADFGANSASAPEQQLDSLQQPEAGWRKLLEMEPRAQSNLVAHAISPDGKWLAVSDLYETKLFELKPHGTEAAVDLILEPRREKSFGAALGGKAPGSSALAFTPDSTRLVCATHPGSFLHVVSISSAGKCALVETFGHHRRRVVTERSVAGRATTTATPSSSTDKSALTNGKLSNGTAHKQGESDAPENEAERGLEEHEISAGAASSARDSHARIDMLVISADGLYLLSGDSSRRLHVFNLDTHVLHRTLPSPAHVPSSASFDPLQSSRLAILMPTNRLLLYDLEQSDAASSADSSMKALERNLRAKLANQRDSAIGVFWIGQRSASSSREASAALLVWGASFICTARKLTEGASAPGTTARKWSRKRGASEAGGSSNGALSGSDGTNKPDAGPAWHVNLTKRYSSLLYVDLLGSSPHQLGSITPTTAARADPELVVVERPFFALTRHLPPAFSRGPRYGS